MDLGLRDKVVVITGSSSGIGAATAEKFGMEGAKVAVTYASGREAAERTAEKIRSHGAEAIAVHYDLTDDRSMDQAVHQIAERWGGIQVLVNNAVLWGDRSVMGLAFEDTDASGWRQTIRANLEGYYYTIQKVLPLMRTSGWGRIINISSELAEDGMAGGGAYTAAKAGLHGLTATLSKELGPAGILTNVVMPGWTMTEKALAIFPAEMIEKERENVPTRKHSAPEDIANLVVFLGSEANGNINGELIRVTGGK
ncbi:SDR family NAD(P)-dependent oxidoreductase [Paenibacillus sp. VMFN-D1]|uniref:SDR family NAD(P)-dependent oxidoreductase n=1 Tax=Paenibacillus sp. VMFN-D1 TaxID=2135608 RepID=UPI000E24884C|nr:SDR family NAD(P)-dependent oxidoreductase [Paenibacillus sp. VMFN-D1]RED37349.1 3-oxoacyl-[acyl-carrier protein] reductase [Paenibacillus sp. VMFN-D1]